MRNITNSKKISAIRYALPVMILIVSACLFLNACSNNNESSAEGSANAVVKSALDGSADDKETYVDMIRFSEDSKNGIACKTKVKEADDRYTILSFDGSIYSAVRSDGTNGTGKYFLSLTGRDPGAAFASEYLIIANEQYIFEDISNDILGLTQPGQIEYFLVDCQPR